MPLFSYSFVLKKTVFSLKLVYTIYSKGEQNPGHGSGSKSSMYLDPHHKEMHETYTLDSVEGAE